MVSYSAQIQRLINKGWTLSEDGFNLIKEERKSISETRPVRVSRFGNRLIKVYNSEGKSPRTVRGRRKLEGHVERFPNSIFAYDKKGNPITVLRGKVISLRSLFGLELMDVATHVMVGNKILREIVRKEDRVELTSISGIAEDEMINVTIYFYKLLAKEKPLYLKFIYVYTFVSTNVKNPNRRMIEVHWETTIKYSEWNSFKEKIGASEYGRISDVTEDWVTKWDMNLYTNTLMKQRRF